MQKRKFVASCPPYHFESFMDYHSQMEDWERENNWEKSRIFCLNINVELSGKELTIKEDYRKEIRGMFEVEATIELKKGQKFEFISASPDNFRNVYFKIKISPVKARGFSFGSGCGASIGYSDYLIKTIEIHPNYFGYYELDLQKMQL